MQPPLAGIRVLELEGLGPGPLCGCVLADFGAEVVSVSRVEKGRIQSQGDPVARGKCSIALDLKSPTGLATLKQLTSKADVFIEPYRPGVAERLGFGPEVLCKENPRLIYGRMTGYGQGGTEFEKLAGHDATYLALSGVLDFFRRGDERPLPPANFAGDYAGGSMMLAMGVLLALVERHRSGKGQVIDAAMVDGVNYLALPLYKWTQIGLAPLAPDGHVDVKSCVLTQAAHFSDVYLCKEDSKKPGTKEYVSVQAIEPLFYRLLLQGLGLAESELPNQYDSAAWPEMKLRFAQIFLQKTRDEWAEIFRGTDACCVPVLSPLEAPNHPHNVARGTFAPTPGIPGGFEPAPSPKLSRTPGFLPRPSPVPGGDTRVLLRTWLGLSDTEVDKLLADGSAAQAEGAASKTQSLTPAARL